MNSDNLIFVVIFVALFVGVFGYVIYAKIKRKDASWSGTVIDKNVSETASDPDVSLNKGSGFSIGGNNRAINKHYSVRIKSDSGKEFSWPVGEGFYESTKVGDRLSKSPGTEIPTRDENGQRPSGLAPPAA